jgi:hypothetical protein
MVTFFIFIIFDSSFPQIFRWNKHGKINAKYELPNDPENKQKMICQNSWIDNELDIGL